MPEAGTGISDIPPSFTASAITPGIKLAIALISFMTKAAPPVLLIKDTMA
jgi:hypothetical protein